MFSPSVAVLTLVSGRSVYFISRVWNFLNADSMYFGSRGRIRIHMEPLSRIAHSRGACCEPGAKRASPVLHHRSQARDHGASLAPVEGRRTTGSPKHK